METTNTGLIHQKMAAIMKATKAIGKDSKNQQQGYKFRGIDAVYNELHDIFSNNEVYVLPHVIEWTRNERPSNNGGVLAFTTVHMKYTFVATDGSREDCTVLGEGMDSGDKSTNKGMSGAQKYALLQVFMIPTEDKKDPENDDPEPKSKEQIKKEACLAAIDAALSPDDLTKIKEQYKPLFDQDKDIKDAGVKKYNELKKKSATQPA